MGDLTDSLTPSATTSTAITPYSRPLPVREDCWSEEATSTLVDAWGRRYLELNRGNLRQKDWQDVADAVNALHAHSKKTHRSDVQCKNRIDTIKKKYKNEKNRVSSSNGALSSSWPFFDRMDALIGTNVKPSANFSPKLSQSPPVAVPVSYRKAIAVNNNTNMHHNISSPNLTPIAAATAVVALPQKRGYNSEGYYRNYSAVAAAAAAAESDEEEEAEEEAEEEGNENQESFGVKRLAQAIEKFGEVYERIEADKLRQMVELEKQRMQFASDLEMQRLRMFTEMQVQLERNKRSKRSTSNGEIIH